MNQQLILAYHDVWPGSQVEIMSGLKRLAELGFGPCALMVVPNWHGQANLEGHPAFVAWLQKMSELGHPLFVHGLHHLIPEKIPQFRFSGKRSFWGQFVNQNWVHSQAELAGLSESLKCELVQQAQASFRKVDLSVTGFTAPTWWGALKRNTVAALGFRWQDRRFYVDDAFENRSELIPALAWPSSPEKNNLVGGSMAYNALRPFVKIRLALHPGDLNRTGFDAVLMRLKQKRQAIAYSSLVSNKIDELSAIEPALATPIYPL